MDLSVIPERQGSQYTRDKVAECVYQYVITGNCTKVGDIAGVPARTVQEWTHTEWWDKAVAEIRAQKQDEIDAALNNLFDDSLRQLHDRVNNGDYVIDKQGDLQRKPVPAAVLHNTMGITFDKIRILRGLATSISQSGSDLGERLRELERKADAKVIPADRTTDGDSK